MVLAIITHTDMDGVGAAGVYLYLNNNPEHRIFFTEPYLLHKTLSKVVSAYYEKIVITDIGINPVIYSKVLEYLSLLRKQGVPVIWFDHHMWENRWIQDLTNLGVELYVDKSTCATGVVAKYAKSQRANIDEEFIREIANGICSGDLWTFNHWLGPYYVRLVRRRDSNSWRKLVVRTIASGKLWIPEFESKVLDHLDRELELFSEKMAIIEKNVGKVKIAIAESNEEVENSFIGSFLIGRCSADIAVIASADGKLSFRSRSVNVRDIALKLGGGGHLYASGAKVNIPWWTRLLSKINSKIFLNYIAEIIAREVEDSQSNN
ncbi:MAG: DHHA1 domain-containing protein [Desulfurococcaceae archaeon]